ncbi:MAG: hypothetical protein FGM43_05330 [Sinobacteraceae bacterium]|nr:hypothetical protein [Nevskiaceae bacterium]
MKGFDPQSHREARRAWQVMACAAITLMSVATATAAPASIHLPVPSLTGPITSPASPVDHSAFTPSTDALPAAVLQGILEIAEGRLQSSPQLLKPLIEGRDALLFPAISLSLFSDGDLLVPVQRGSMVRELATKPPRSYWRVIPQTGRIWREPGDGEWSRAALPLMLVNDTENHAHQGVATFLYREGAVSALRLQFAQHTGPYLLKQHAVLWGSAALRWRSAAPTAFDAERALARRERDERLPVKPWTELVKQFPTGSLDGFGGPVLPHWQVLNAVVYRGTLYVQDSPTPYGPYPYPLEMRFGVRSVMKSIAAPLALLRLAETLGPYVLELRIGDYVPGLDAKFSRIRFIDAANMASGFGGLGSLVTRPNDPYAGYLEGDYDGWYTAPSSAEKLQAIRRNLKPYPWEPGTVMRYRDQDYFLLGVAIDGFLKSVRGADADLWRMLQEEVFAPIGIRQAPAVRTRESSERDGVIWANAGYYPTVEELAKIALLLQAGGAHQGRQILHGPLTRDLLAAREALVPTVDGTQGVDAATRTAAPMLYRMGYWFPRYVSARDGIVRHLPSMQGSGENRVTLYPNGIIALHLGKASELPAGERATSDDADATHRIIERLAGF